MLDEAGGVVGAGEHAAGEPVGPLVAGRQHRLLAALADRLAVGVLVDDRLADDEHLEVRGRPQRGEHLFRGVPRGEVGEELPHRVGELREVLVDQRRRAVGDVLGEGDLAADGADRLALLGNVADRVLEVAELAPLDEHVRAEQVDRLDGGRPAVDGDVIDRPQRGDDLGPERVGERRAVGALVDEPVGGEGDDEDVAELAGLLEVADVADVEQVEHAVAVDDPAALGAETLQGRGQLVERADLGAGGHARASLPGWVRAASCGSVRTGAGGRLTEARPGPQGELRRPTTPGRVEALRDATQEARFTTETQRTQRETQEQRGEEFD